jgi:hypothetical protein
VLLLTDLLYSISFLRQGLVERLHCICICILKPDAWCSTTTARAICPNSDEPCCLLFGPRWMGDVIAASGVHTAGIIILS